MAEPRFEAVKLLTKKDGYVMSEYISAIKENPIAKAVKAADRLHNLRSAVTTDERFKCCYIFESIDWFVSRDIVNCDYFETVCERFKEFI